MKREDITKRQACQYGMKDEFILYIGYDNQM